MNRAQLAGTYPHRHLITTVFRSLVTAVRGRLYSDKLDAASVQPLRQQRLVLVRTTQCGLPISVYHCSLHPCGHVTGRHRSREHFEQLTLEEAAERNLRPCRTCGPRAMVAA
jgi:hypothetical protein